MCWQLSMNSASSPLPTSYDVARPPRNGRDSRTLTECPAPPSAAAVASPAKPPPMTMTSAIGMPVFKGENYDATGTRLRRPPPPPLVSSMASQMTMARKTKSDGWKSMRGSIMADRIQIGQVPYAPVRLASAGTNPRTTQHAHHVFHQLQAAVSVQRKDGFGMELHCFHGQLAMTHAHDHAIFRLCGDFEHGGELLPDSVQRIIAAYAEFLRQTFEYAHAAVLHQ